MRFCGEDVTEINVKPDGSWSAKTRGEFSDLAQWHFPDGSISIARDVYFSNLASLRQIKQEDNTEEHSGLKKVMRKNHGEVTVNEHRPVVVPSRNQLEANYENSGLNVITMSSSATSRSGRDDGNPSINQDCGGLIDIPTNDGNEINSISPIFEVLNCSSALGDDADIIVLSDSEEENDLVCPVSAFPSVPDSYVEDPTLNMDVGSCLGLFNGNGSGNGSEIGLSPWPYSSGTQLGPAFQRIGTDSDVSDAFIDLEHTSVSCSAPMNGKIEVNSGGQVLGSSVCDASSEIDGGLVDNPLAFVSEDPSLQNFLPTQPLEMFKQPNREHQHPVLSGFEDWISLRVGSKGEIIDSDVGAHVVPATVNGLDLRNSNGLNEGRQLCLVTIVYLKYFILIFRSSYVDLI